MDNNINTCAFCGRELILRQGEKLSHFKRRRTCGRQCSLALNMKRLLEAMSGMPRHNFTDLSGRRFGRLIVLTRAENNARGKSYWLCQCDCGEKTKVRADGLRGGSSQSCGCLGRERRLKATQKHGLSKCSQYYHPLYSVWDGIIQRCTNSNSGSYRLYGERGIAICKEWRNDFTSFYNWALSNGYEKGKQIDRINVDGGYKPSNCRWVTTYEQARNKRSNVYVEYEGKKMCLTDAAALAGIKMATIYYRRKRNKPLFAPIKGRSISSGLPELMDAGIISPRT